MFSHLPQLNSLRVFDAAARLKSFKAAALELYVTPTAVSHQIRTLEEKLGTLLFERKTRLVLLTPEGEILAQAAHQSLLKLSAAIETISNDKKVLTVSTTASFAALWLVPNLERFYQSHSDISVVVKSSEEMDDVKRDRRVDVAIRYGEFDSQMEHATQLVSEQFGMYATKQYLQQCPDIQAATLLETKWKNPNLRAITWRQYSHQQGNVSQDLTIRAYDQEQHVIQAALAGQGVALVSSLLVQTALQNQWLVQHPHGTVIAGLTYYMLTKDPAENSHKVEVFRQWLLDEFELLS
jgi:LysR family transcriptional regulator, glycine cleavage system transcriptional activator